MRRISILIAVLTAFAFNAADASVSNLPTIDVIGKVSQEDTIRIKLMKVTILTMNRILGNKVNDVRYVYGNDYLQPKYNGIFTNGYDNHKPELLVHSEQIIKDRNMFVLTVIHEIGHYAETNLSADKKTEWNEICSNNKPSVSDYSKTTCGEDFAETLTAYVSQNDQLKTKAEKNEALMKKYDFFKNLFQSRFENTTFLNHHVLTEKEEMLNDATNVMDLGDMYYEYQTPLFDDACYSVTVSDIDLVKLMKALIKSL